jgi:protein tyrosine/serine phosphatase
MSDISEQDLNLIKQLAGNKNQFEAVKQFLLEPLEPHNLDLSLELSNVEYGERSKVAAKAKKALEEKFVEMERLLEKKSEPNQINQAR